MAIMASYLQLHIQETLTSAFIWSHVSGHPTNVSTIFTVLSSVLWSLSASGKTPGSPAKCFTVLYVHQLVDDSLCYLAVSM